MHLHRSLVCVGWTLVFSLSINCGGENRQLDWSEVDRLIQNDHPDVPSVTTAELADALANGRHILLLDVREAAEFAVSHLPCPMSASVEICEPVLGETRKCRYCEPRSGAPERSAL